MIETNGAQPSFLCACWRETRVPRAVLCRVCPVGVNSIGMKLIRNYPLLFGSLLQFLRASKTAANVSEPTVRFGTFYAVIIVYGG